MSFDILLNPEGMESIYLDNLNLSFGHWGDAEFYRWCFHRQIGDLQADMMIFKKDGQVIAGSAVTYRPLLLGKSILNAGIMTGSWTRPEARGQGCFAKIIEESLSLASRKRVALLLAFVTETNPSSRGLARARASTFPTHYLFSDQKTPVPTSSQIVSPVSNPREGLTMLFERLRRDQEGLIHFTYTEKEWETQFLKRPGTVEFLQIGDDGLAVVEKKAGFDRVLFLSLEERQDFTKSVGALLRRALESGQHLFLFTTSAPWKDECRALGLGYAPGYLTALVADKAELIRTFPGTGSSSGKVVNEFYDPASPWHAGVWDVQSGDRM